jgi:hypothetical protein
MSLSSCYAIKLTQVKFPQAKDRKRKRLQEVEGPLLYYHSLSERPRASPPRSPIYTTGKNTGVGINRKEINPIEYRRKEGAWPEEYFNTESNISHLLAMKKSLPFLRAKQSEAGSTTPRSTTSSDQKPRETKSTPYSRPSYETVLATKGSFMGKFDLGTTDASKKLCRTLLKAELVPQDTQFRGDLFDATWECASQK